VSALTAIATWAKEVYAATEKAQTKIGSPVPMTSAEIAAGKAALLAIIDAAENSFSNSATDELAVNDALSAVALLDPALVDLPAAAKLVEFFLPVLIANNVADGGPTGDGTTPLSGVPADSRGR
jgi:hypothetical protein